jgi:hypothetical protein
MNAGVLERKKHALYIKKIHGIKSSINAVRKDSGPAAGILPARIYSPIVLIFGRVIPCFFMRF